MYNIDYFISNFINNKNTFFYYFDENGINYPLLLPSFIIFYLILFLILKNINFFKKLSLFSLVKISLGIVFSSFFVLFILTNNLTSHKEKKVIDEFSNKFNNSLIILENSKILNDNIKFLNILLSIKNIYHKKSKISDIDYKIIQKYYLKSKIYNKKYKYFNIKKYLLKKYKETKNIKYIKYYLIEDITYRNYEDTKKFKILISKKFCKYNKNDLEIKKCNIDKLLKNKWVLNDKVLLLSDELKIKIAKKMKDCNGANYLKEEVSKIPFYDFTKIKFIKIINEINTNNNCGLDNFIKNENKKIDEFNLKFNK